MLFQTWPFLLFFVVVYAGYRALGRTRYWIHWILLASYFFYGWWNPLYLLLIAYSTLLDYVVVILMDRGRKRGVWLAVSLINNLLLLGCFKYAGFLTDNINGLLSLSGSTWALSAPNVLLPVGISFYTFQSMSYTIDFYRGRIKREPNLVRFAAFVSLFPQLIAGPIERAGALLPQLRRFPRIVSRDVTDGMSLFLVGLFKKLALADFLGQYLTPIYASPEQYDAGPLLVATFAFAWQIYFDFSGYTDMARGVARAMGIRLMINFRNPYLAESLGDFWSRWHISLSTWFRDYVYIPLGGNRWGAAVTYRNLFATMVISGLWHGAAWKFVIWGMLHALATMLTREMERSRWYRERVPKIAKQILVFAFVCFAWVFFRADTSGDALLILGRMTSRPWGDTQFPLLLGLLISLAWAHQYLSESRVCWLVELPVVRVVAAVTMILYLCLVPGTSSQPFIYFQF